jgi:anti-sigma factor RsiW
MTKEEEKKGTHRHSCEALVDLLCDYLEGELPLDERAEIDRHMADCPPCLAFLNTYQKTAEICRALRPEDIPKEVQERLIRFLVSQGR